MKSSKIKELFKSLNELFKKLKWAFFKIVAKVKSTPAIRFSFFLLYKNKNMINTYETREEVKKLYLHRARHDMNTKYALFFFVYASFHGLLRQFQIEYLQFCSRIMAYLLRFSIETCPTDFVTSLPMDNVIKPAGPNYGQIKWPHLHHLLIFWCY